MTLNNYTILPVKYLRAKKRAFYPLPPMLLNARMKTVKITSTAKPDWTTHWAQEIQVSIFYGFCSIHAMSNPTRQKCSFHRREFALLCCRKQQPQGLCRCSDISVMTLLVFVQKETHTWFSSLYFSQPSSWVLSTFLNDSSQALKREPYGFLGKVENKDLVKAVSQTCPSEDVD